jgi:MFS family permease
LSAISHTTAVPLQKVTSRAWLVVGLLFVVGCLNYLDRIMITTMRSSIVDAIPMTDAQFGLLTSVFLWIYGLLSPFAGFMADRYSRSRVIIISLFVWSLVTWMTVHAQTFNQLLLTRALMGVSEACYIPAALALIADYHRGSTRSLAMGIHMAGIMIGQSLGFLGGFIAEKYAWTDAFALIGIIGVIYAAVLLFLLKDAPRQAIAIEEPKPAPVKLGTALKDLFSRKGFIMVLIFWGMLGIVGWMVLGWLPTFYKERFHLTQSAAGLYATGYLYPVSMAGVLLGGFLADRWSKTNLRARILVPAIGLCIAAPFVFTGSMTDILPLAIGCFMVYGLTRSFSDTNMMPILCMVADDRYRATGYGVLNLFSCIVGGIGLYAGGALRDAHVDVSLLFRVAAVCMVFCAFILFRLRPVMTKF